MAATFVAMPTKLANVVRISEKDASQTYLQNVKGCTWVLASTAGGSTRMCSNLCREIEEGSGQK